jgi:DNA-binding NarL/FixJ family response regulator
LYPTQTPIQLQAPQVSSPAAPQLTARERDLVRAVARGLNNRQIAAEFSLSEQTVKNHLTGVYQKLHLTSRLQLAVHAMRNDLA